MTVANVMSTMSQWALTHQRRILTAHRKKSIDFHRKIPELQKWIGTRKSAAKRHAGSETMGT
jgi:predicted RNA-binding protein with RPS1 domain